MTAPLIGAKAVTSTGDSAHETKMDRSPLPVIATRMRARYGTVTSVRARAGQNVASPAYSARRRYRPASRGLVASA